MQRRTLILGVICAALLSGMNAGSAQLAIRATAGTTGVGGDISIGIVPRIALRAGVSVMPVKPEGTFSDAQYSVDLPSPLYSAGADLYLLGGVRLMGGVLIGAERVLVTGIYNGTADIGGTQYSGNDLGTLSGELTSKNIAPYVGIGFGKTVGPGVGLSLDIGGAFLGKPTMALSANGPCTTIEQCNTQLELSLRQEEADMQQDIEKYAKIYPMVSLGLRFGF